MEPHIISAIIMCTWLYIWFDLARHSSDQYIDLPHNPRIKLAAIILLLVISVFYTTLYTTNEFILALTPLQLLACFVLLAAGVGLVIGARNHMRSLSMSQVLFSLNPIHTKSSVYKICKHPMYVGIGLILVASWFMLPSLPALYSLLCSLMMLVVKAVVETKEYRQLTKQSR